MLMKQSAAPIALKRLGDDDAADYRGVNFDSENVDQQMGAGSVLQLQNSVSPRSRMLLPIEEERGAAGRSALYPATQL
jgi:hypothetical protein